VHRDHDDPSSGGFCDHERAVQDQVRCLPEQCSVFVAERLALGSVHDDGVDTAWE